MQMMCLQKLFLKNKRESREDNMRTKHEQNKFKIAIMLTQFYGMGTKQEQK